MINDGGSENKKHNISENTSANAKLSPQTNKRFRKHNNISQCFTVRCCCVLVSRATVENASNPQSFPEFVTELRTSPASENTPLCTVVCLCSSESRTAAEPLSETLSQPTNLLLQSVLQMKCRLLAQSKNL